MTRRGAVGAALVGLLVLLPLTGCGGKPAPRLWPEISPVSDAGTGWYYQAREAWAHVRAEDPEGEELREGMEQVLARLRSAVDNDPKNPLFHSKMGDIWLSMGPEYIGKAREHYTRAHALCEQWVPAWLGWAAVADLERNPADLQQAIDGAATAIEAMETPQNQAAPQRMSIFSAIGLMPQTPEDPDMTVENERRMLVTWMRDGETWTIDNAGLLGKPDFTHGSKIDPNWVFNRLRARVVMMDAVLADLNAGTPADVHRLVEQALDYDPNYLQARIARAIGLIAAGKPEAAAAIVDPYVTSDNPMLANNAELLGLAANIYREWYARSGDVRLATKAEEYFRRLHARRPTDAGSLIDRALLATLIAERNPDRAADLKATAQKYLQLAEQNRGDAGAIRKVRDRLAKPASGT